ncbi:hypothetical protein KR084_007595 [Drosophila pseudotakahashii]|nr:hypothetical protein KR084_007595 [Drosophila pseudotakahashii]
MWNRTKVYENTTAKNEEDDHEDHIKVRTGGFPSNLQNESQNLHLQPEGSSSLPYNSTNMSIKRNQLPYSRPIPQNREELLESIGRDREVLGAYFQRLTSQREEPTAPDVAPPAPNSPAPHRNSYDLFFESACISVKGLPPKLAAEAKSRISQIITEFEIRAISELEAQQERQMQAQPRIDNASGIVYEFRPCS